MEARFNCSVVTEAEDTEMLPAENSGDSPPSATLNDSRMAPTSSAKRRHAVQKTVVSVPIKNVEEPGFRAEMSAPPSDSWAWRKYGQKPIKGSPYPRGYYRCSSSKGCPARKQVERSREDPNMLVITYSCEHNHPRPASRNSHHQINTSTAPTSDYTAITRSTIDTATNATTSDQNFVNLSEESLIFTNEFGWFSDFGSSSSTMLEDPILVDDTISDTDMTMIFSTSEEDESLFADLGELPDCSIVFRRGAMERGEEPRPYNSGSLCGTIV